MDNEIIVIVVGKPGPAAMGGPTVPEWNAYKSNVDNLLSLPSAPNANGYRRNSGGGSYTHLGGSASARLGDPIWSAFIGSTHFRQLVIWGEADVTTQPGQTATTQIDIYNGTHLGPVDNTPAGSANYRSAFGFGLVLPPGSSSPIEIGIRIAASNTAAATWSNVRLWGFVQRLG